MNSYSTKARHILPTFLSVTIGSAITLALIRYLFAIQIELLDFKPYIWEFLIPFCFPWIPMAIWLRPKLNILSFRKGRGDKQFFFQILTCLTMLPYLIASQMYLSSSGNLHQASSIGELNDQELSGYCRIEKFRTYPTSGATYVDNKLSGKNGRALTFNIYFVSQLVDTSINIGQPEYKYWYGVNFSARISSKTSASETNRLYKQFYDDCFDKMAQYNYYNASYFKILANTEDRDGFLKAVKTATKESTGDVVILKPMYGDFDQRFGEKIGLIFFFYFGGLIIFLLFLTWPSVNKWVLKDQLQNNKLRDHVE